jgi:hypothetical protein
MELRPSDFRSVRVLLEKFGWSDAKVDEALPRLWRMANRSFRETRVMRCSTTRTTTEFWNVRCLRARCSWFLGIGICCAYVSKNPYPSYRCGNSWKRVSVARADGSLNTSADTITFVSATMHIYFLIALFLPRTSCTSRSTSSSRMPCRSAPARPYSLTSSHQDRRS